MLQHQEYRKWDFPGGPVVKTSSNAGNASSVPGWGAKILHALWPKYLAVINRNNIVTNSVKTLKMIHIQKNLKIRIQKYEKIVNIHGDSINALPQDSSPSELRALLKVLPTGNSPPYSSGPPLTVQLSPVSWYQQMVPTHPSTRLRYFLPQSFVRECSL